jgi:hypothetical protein
VNIAQVKDGDALTTRVQNRDDFVPQREAILFHQASPPRDTER